MPKGQKPYKPLKRQSVLGTVPVRASVVRPSEQARDASRGTFSTKPRPALQREEYIDQKVEEMSK